MIWDLEHKNKKPVLVNKFWTFDENGEMHEVSEDEYDEFQASLGDIEEEGDYKNEDLLDPTTNDKI